jgi:hypothetical protein
MRAPLANGRNGRDPSTGRFAKGNPGGPGSPQARHARQLRERLNDALFKTCSPDRLLAAIDAVLKLAESGDTAALKLLMERIAGPPVAVEIQERLEALEQRLEELNARKLNRESIWDTKQS